MKRRLIQNIVVVVLGTFMIAACSEVEEQHDFAGKNIPIEFDFSFANESGTTRSTSLATNKTVYVFDGTSYYPYKYVFDNDRWECDSDEPLTWKGAQMPLWAFVRNDNEIMSSTNMLTNIQPDQARYGIEGSDFLACVDTYDFSTGIIKMTLEHKVAKLVVKVTNCYDASQMTCSTVSAISTQGQITIGQNDITVAPKSGSSISTITLFRSDYNATEKTADFTAYLLPQNNFTTKYHISCGSINYDTEDLTVNLEAGKTSTITINLATIESQNADNIPGLWEYFAQEDGHEGAQEFTAPVSGKYKLEVWGAQGGCYKVIDYTNNFVDNTGGYNTDYSSTYSTVKFSKKDELWRGTKECTGGYGAYVRGTITLSKGDKLYVYVGKKPEEDYLAKNLITTGWYYKPGGWNGGAGSVAQAGRSDVCAGGGATDIALKNATWDTPEHMFSRIIVAGGGGGGLYYPGEQGYYDGGHGGGGKFLGTSTWNGGDADGYLTAYGRGALISRPLRTIRTWENSTSNGVDLNNHACLTEINSDNVKGLTPYASSTPSTFADVPLYATFGIGGGCYWGTEGIGNGGGGWYGGCGGNGWMSNGAGGGGSSYAWTDQVTYDGTPLCDFYKNISKIGYVSESYRNRGSGSVNVYVSSDGNYIMLIKKTKNYDSYMTYIDAHKNPEGETDIFLDTDGVRKTYDSNGNKKVIKYFLTDVANQGGVNGVTYTMINGANTATGDQFGWGGQGHARITLLAE